MTNRISLIVATKDRPDDLFKLLGSLAIQTVQPAQIVIVDASVTPVDKVLDEFPELNILYLRHWPPSAAAQRNSGIRACDSDSTLIGFADDDTAFEPQAFERMLSFWDSSGAEVVGAAFNFRNSPRRGGSLLKRARLTEWLGLYSGKPGSVSSSGWQTVVGELSETDFVEWLPSGACVFRREVLERDLFDEFYKAYSYLEDLDISYSISRKGKLAIVADAGFYHFPSPKGRVSDRQFGQFEVRNRLYFVRKHKLSILRCYVGLLIRLAISVGSGLARCDGSFLLRALGNIEELIKRQSDLPLEIPILPKS